MEAPKATGKAPEEITLTRKVIPWAAGQAVLLGAPGSLWRYLPVFDSTEVLAEFLERVGIEWDSVKQVYDGLEFVSGFEGTDIKVINNPRFTEEGKIRFEQVESGFEV